LAPSVGQHLQSAHRHLVISHMSCASCDLLEINNDGMMMCWSSGENGF